ncbi:tripartite tricarboxylate transporter TctB family protein [Hydrogenophaga crassostreae]|nr:tripartite tricarboxylate transporter TctB family protein [Hydrogenophaga crassostreae]
MKVADIVGGLIGIFTGLWVLWTSSNMPADVVMKIGPGFFPSMLAGGLILFSGALLVKAIQGKSKGRLESRQWSDVGVRRGLITLCAAILFVAVMEPLGFIPTSIVFLTFMMWVLGKRNPLLIGLVPTLITAGVWLVFEKLLHLSMPPGVLDSLL